MSTGLSGLEIAIVGMAGRFPGAPDVETFWRNLCAGVESIRRFTREELEGRVPRPAELDHPAWVAARAPIEDPERFDARFFEINPREAEITDPQHRLFLECCWEALERAGCDPSTHSGRIGVFGGCSLSSYLLANLLPNEEVLAEVGSFQAMIANDKDYLTTRVSYKLDLRGPSVLVQTACSTSLVAVHLACQSLLNGECEMALAGAASVSFPAVRGHLHQEGGIFSPDGHCRPFDAGAGGTVNGDGVGVVVLKRLEDAVTGGDRIHAVLKGSAINNDGSAKVGFTAPGAEGQATVIGAAQVMAGVEADDIGYVEAHGTATLLGDPIEVAALTDAFRVTTDRTRFCALGSLKSNVGHLDTAAGVAGLIKAALALERGVIPPTLHFERPNPKIDFDASPFFVVRDLRPWPAGETPRRAAVSSFGIGGTNAHAVLEEAPPPAPGSPSRPAQVVVLSVRTPAALERATDALAEALEDPGLDFADAAFTAKTGRRAFEHRRALVCGSAAEAASILRSRDPKRLLTGHHAGGARPVCFLFPGQGAQYPGMAEELYRREPAFREHLDLCAAELRPRLGVDPLEVLFPGEASEGAAERLRRTDHAQPLLFSVEYALARLWEEWGVQPAAMAGHSLGEYVAACLAGVMSLPDALRLVAARGRLMQALPEGAMLSVESEPEALVPRLGGGLAVAAVNAPGLCTVAGPTPEIAALAADLTAAGIENRRLHTSHAFHSPMMEPVLGPFAQELRAIELRPPRRRYLSNLTGGWVTDREATDPEHWIRHLREPVRFADNAAELLRDPDAVLLEVGPGRSLGSLVRRQPGWTPGRPVLACLPQARDAGEGEPADDLLHTVARLWLTGAKLDWRGFYAHERRRKTVLPTYPFEREAYWIEPRRRSAGLALPVGEASAPVAAAGAAETASGHSRPALAVAYVAPGTEVERGLAAVWSSLLGVEPVGLHDDFFDLGGHSLLATRVLSRVRDRFGVDVKLRRLLEAPTIADLAAEIEAVRQEGAGPDLPALEPAAREDGAPLSFVQERFWFLDQLEPGSPAYNLPFTLRLAGALDPGLLSRSLDEIRRRHEALRTVIDGQGDRPVQRVRPYAPLPLPVADLSALPEEPREREVRRLATANALEPFHLTEGPLLRTRLLRLAAEEWALLVSLHHIVADGWSFGVITRELSELYGAFRRGAPSPLPELAVQYGDFACWQRSWMHGPVLEEQLAYWRRELAHPPAELRLPTRRPPGEGAPGFRGAVHPLAFPADLTAALRDLGRRHRCTLFMTLLGAFDALLGIWSGQDDLLVGSPIAGRRHSGTEALVGCFINTLVLRADLSGDPTYEEILARVRRSTLDAYAHQDLPFERLVSVLRLDRGLDRNPLFRVWFVLQSSPAEALRLPGVAAAAVPPGLVAVRHDLKLDLTEQAGVLGGFFEYRTHLFDEGTVRLLGEQFEGLLRRVVERPEARLSELAAELSELSRQKQAAARHGLRSDAQERLLQRRRKSASEPSSQEGAPS